MKQTFVKTIQSHLVEFNRLMYPERYKVMIRVANENPVTCTVNNTDDGWNLSKENCPDWVSEMHQDIIEAVRANEESHSE